MIIIKSLQWYIFIQLLAVIAFVLTFKSFNNLSDKGYCISKVLGITIPAFICWLIMSFNFEAFSFSPLISYTGAGITALITIMLVKKTYKREDYQKLKHFFDSEYKFILFIEAIFLGLIIIGAYHRGFSPDILNIHKLQELVYINDLLSCNSLPPDNSWLSGYKTNHYYFGYFILANLINISFMHVKFAFNLIPGTLLAIIAITAGGLIYNITNNKNIGILGGLFTGFIGNYVTIKQLIEDGLKNDYNWFIPIKDISGKVEAIFPFWSFNLGDIQPYFISHITFLAVIYLSFIIIKEKLFLINSKITINTALINILLAIMIAITFLINIYTLPFMLITIILLYLYNETHCQKDINRTISSLGSLLIIISTTTILCLPFILSYKFPDIVINTKERILLTDSTSFLLWFGVFLIPVLIFILIELKNYLKLNNISAILIIISVLSVIEIILIYKTNISVGIINILTLLALLSIIIFSIYKILKYNNNSEVKKKSIIILAIIVALSIEFTLLKSLNAFIICATIIFSTFMLLRNKDLGIFTTFILLFASMLILLLAISFNINLNIKDNYTINGYMLSQVQLILPIILTLIVFYSITNLSNLSKDIYMIIISLILVPSFAFTLLGPYYKSNKLNIIPGLVPNLSGENHLIHFHNPEYNSIQWLKNNTAQNQVVLEGFKNTDTYSGRITGYSNRQAVLQWPREAELTYGKKIEPELKQRIKDIQQIYSEEDKTKILPLIKKYKIDYIYIGEIETDIYPPNSLNSFDQIGKLVFNITGQNGKTSKIYQIKKEHDL